MINHSSPRHTLDWKRLALILLFGHVQGAMASDWARDSDSVQRAPRPDLSYVERTLVRGTDGRTFTVHLALFNSSSFRLEVIDLGGGDAPIQAEPMQTFIDKGCAAGVNGGFFHPNWRPLGLMIAQGTRINRFETAKLLSGVLYDDQKGIHLVRSRQFQDHPGIRALLQSGPYLIEHGKQVAGLSADKLHRRTFVATDWRGHWLIGVTLTPITLAELGSALASAGVMSEWPIDRAINLDGGSSTGFFFDPGELGSPVSIQPWKRVRNLLCVLPR